ncbi:hypothetical protein [Pseudodesulfovibrio sp.]|uniref:hypothetical protein n=1 Tax=unclassified Pseudodesulfovibrio TaxID=2661612 RepID=UPI003AFFAA63
MHKAIKVILEYKVYISTISVLAYVVRPMVLSNALGYFIPILLSSPICTFIIVNMKPTTKGYLRTLFSMRSTAYSALSVFSILMTGYLYAIIKIISNLDVSLFLSFIPISAIYYFFSPILVWLCKRQWSGFQPFKKYIEIAFFACILTTFSILVRSMHLDNKILIEVFAFSSVFMLITTFCVLAGLISPDKPLDEMPE